MKKVIVRKCYLLASVFIFLVFMAGCSKPLNPVAQNGNNSKAKGAITNVLNSNKEISQITWSPDETTVLYVQKGNPEKAGSNEVYAWKVSEEQAKLISDVSPSFLGFTWSPNSKFFLISENLGEGVFNSVFNAGTLMPEGDRIKSLDVPVWSADSMFLAYGFEQHDYGESWGSLQVYELGQANGEYIWNTKNYIYKVEYWDVLGNIGYLEIDDKGKQSHKTTQNIRPSISGVHLKDTREQVIAALGNDYIQTPPEEATMNFPEPVYRWTYLKGYEVFMGQNTGKVWEIMTTFPTAETNLGAKIGDSAAKVFEIYRPKYIEPESVHGGKLYGIFKVEGAAALSFKFNTEAGTIRPEIKPDSKVISIDLTYPSIMDDDFLD
ncbi:MAG TPA: hypothetical protein VN374_04960 [Desulfitobacteriaceae bacterium]|nr:hypothetical protein [Desulfitobacteriaceae bacterium]